MSVDYTALKIQLIQQLKDTLDELKKENAELKQQASQMAGRLRRQADILNSLAERFYGEYAWIEKAGMHSSEVSMVMKESVRRMKEAANELESRVGIEPT